jgi:hypothetical protein
MSESHITSKIVGPFSQSELRSIAIDMVNSANLQKLAFRQSPLTYAEYLIEAMRDITGINFTWAPEEVHKLLPHLSIETCGKLFGVVVDWKGRSLNRIDPPDINPEGALDQKSMLNDSQYYSESGQGDVHA